MSQELLQGLCSVVPNGTTVKLENDHLLFTGHGWAPYLISYIPIEDPTHTFEYDITYESEAGNYFYFGIEGYDINKATGSNSCCKYQIATNNTAHSKRRIRGTLNLNYTISDTNTNKPAFIRLRILNQWSGSSGTNVTAKIYHMSLREIIGDTNKIKTHKNGQLTSDTFWEGYSAGFNKLSVVESNQLFEY